MSSGRGDLSMAVIEAIKQGEKGGRGVSMLEVKLLRAHSVNKAGARSRKPWTGQASRSHGCWVRKGGELKGKKKKDEANAKLRGKAQTADPAYTCVYLRKIGFYTLSDL